MARAKGADPREALRRVDRNHTPRLLLARPADIAHVQHTLVQQRAPRVHQPAMHPPRLRRAARIGNATTDAALARGRTRVGAVAAILAPAAVAVAVAAAAAAATAARLCGAPLSQRSGALAETWHVEALHAGVAYRRDTAEIGTRSGRDRGRAACELMPRSTT